MAVLGTAFLYLEEINTKTVDVCKTTRNGFGK
jgi:hypothetical protein